MARSVEDTMLVLNVISGPDAGDGNSRPSKLDFNARVGVPRLRVGYVPAWMKENPATAVDRAGAASCQGGGDGSRGGGHS